MLGRHEARLPVLETGLVEVAGLTAVVWTATREAGAVGSGLEAQTGSGPIAHRLEIVGRVSRSDEPEYVSRCVWTRLGADSGDQKGSFEETCVINPK
jgi:hypothetical protein